jgi:hypothetical protein
MDQLLKILSSYLDRPELIAVVGLLAILFFLALSILWFMLPFAIFGTKKKLDEIINERQKTNKWFEELVAKNQKMNSRLSEIMSESKRTTARLSELKTEMKPVEEPEIHLDAPQDSISSPSEKRKLPRLEFHCTGTVMGKEVTITDISLGGLFIELNEIPELLKVGQITNIDMDLPTENESLRMKVKIVSQNNRGVGCKYFDLSQDNLNAINNCFDEFKDTLPIRDPDETGGASPVQNISKDTVAPYQGSTSSKVFHKKKCRYYQNCTVTFSNREAAVIAGYKPCGICKP